MKNKNAWFSISDAVNNIIDRSNSQLSKDVVTTKNPVLKDYHRHKLPGAFGDIYITKVIYQKPATIVFFSDGTKSVCKCAEGDTYSREAGLSICILKWLLGATKTYELFKAWLPNDELPENTVRTLADVRKDEKNTGLLEK